MLNENLAVAPFEKLTLVEKLDFKRQMGDFTMKQSSVVVMRTDVLIAEADAKLCVAYERMLAGSGLLIETAVDGLDCWSKLRARCPDALMIDMDLLWGGSDGVLARLREDSNVEVRPEVFVTGDESPEILSRRAGVAVGRCFQKPLEMSAVLDSICDAFSSEAEITFLGIRV